MSSKPKPNQNQVIDLKNAFVDQAVASDSNSENDSQIFGNTFQYRENSKFHITKIAKENINASTLTKSGFILALLALIFYLLPNQTPTEAMPTNLVATEQFVAITTDEAVAGQTVILRSTPVDAGSLVTASIRKPDSEDIMLSSRADQSGVAQMTLLGSETEMAGIYTIRATADNFISRDTSFRVKAGPLNIDSSRFTIDKALVRADGQDEAAANIILRDQFDNPIANNEIHVISSRNLDFISKEDERTNQNGELTAKIRSITSGTSYITAFDGESGQVLGRPLEIKFYAPGETIGDLRAQDIFSDSQAMTSADDDLQRILEILKNERQSQTTDNYTLDAILEQERRSQPRKSTSSYMMTNLTSPFATSDVHHFEVEGIPDTVTIGKPISSIKIRAVDGDGFRVDDYQGTIHFRSSDDRAVLPLDTKFNQNNAGERSFDLALTFLTAGEQTLIVEDVDDNNIFGRVENITVEGKASLATAAPVITSPIEGTTISTSQIKIAGRAPSNALVSIYDGTKKLGETVTNEGGRWIFEANNLFDGTHKLAAVATDTDNEVSPVSETVIITIDSTNPQPVNITLDPETAAPRARVQIALESEQKLTKAEITIDRRIIELSVDPDDPKLYTGSFIAPKDHNSYDIDVILTDDLGNSKTYREMATLRVTDAVTSEEADNTESKETTETILQPVTGVRVIDRGADYITLTWRSVDSADRYQIKYGETADDLAYAVAITADETRGTVDGLIADVNYYFAVVALDKNGQASEITEESRAIGRPKQPEKYAYEDEIAVIPSSIGTSSEVEKSDETNTSSDSEVKVLDSNIPDIFANSGTVQTTPQKKVIKKIIRVPRPEKTSDVGPGGAILLSALGALALDVAIRRRKIIQ